MNCPIGLLRVALVVWFSPFVVRATLVMPPASPTGRPWVLSTEQLIANPTFEADANGSTPAGWTGAYGPITATNAAAYGGAQSMHVTVQAYASTDLPTQVGKYYRYEVHWMQQTNDWGPNLRIGLLKDPGFVPSGPGVDIVAPREADTWPDAVFEYTNGRQPMWRDYTYNNTTWQTWSATLEVLPSISDFGNKLTPFYYGTADTWWRVDSLSLQEFVLLPEPSTVLLLALGGLLLGARKQHGGVE